MRVNDLQFTPVPGFDAEAQLSLPFVDSPDPARTPVAHRQLVKFGGRRPRTYELVVHCDPSDGCVLAYRVSPVTQH